MTDLTDLCAAALVATRHAYEDEDNASLWSAAVDAWQTAAVASRVENPTAMQQALTDACNRAMEASMTAWSAAFEGGDIQLPSRCALTAAEVVMMWID
jgi:hypothetical protein